MVADDGHHGVVHHVQAAQLVDEGADATVSDIDAVEVIAGLGIEDLAGSNPRGPPLAGGERHVHRHCHHLEEEGLTQFRKQAGGKLGERGIVNVVVP